MALKLTLAKRKRGRPGQLSPAQVLEIRARHARRMKLLFEASKDSMKAIAKDLGMSSFTVEQIIARRYYKWVVSPTDGAEC